MKKLMNYLHLYLGCDVVVHDDDPKKRLVRTFFGFSDPSKTGVYIYDRLSREGKTMVIFIKPILRPLSDMTEEEAEHFAWLCLNSPHAPKDFDAVGKDEIQIEFVRNDGGLMLDDDVEIYIGVSCRCLDGWISIMRDGRIGMSDDADAPSKDMRPVDDVYGKVQWLLSKRFDLFGLIEDGLAVTASRL
jgi:hypothetical protein